ncbi:unnamed protein product [Prunus armeniaca]
MTPQEAWNGKKPLVDHFKMFRCIVYAHVRDQRRKKLNDKREKCVFLGVSETPNAYKLFNLVTKKVVISRDVVFEEETMWNWTDGNSIQNPILDNDASDCDIEEVPDIQEQQSLQPMAQPHQQLEEESGYNLRDENTKKKPTWMMDYDVSNSSSDDDNAHFALFVDSDPITYDEVIKEKKWRKVMDNEIKSTEKNHTWELTDLPKGQKTIGVKWVFRTKMNEKGDIDKHKARLVAKSYKQKHGIDYKEVFAPVARQDTIRLVISPATQNSWSIFQLDVKLAFLHGVLQEEVYSDQPSSYEKKRKEEKGVPIQESTPWTKTSTKSLADGASFVGYTNSDCAGDIDDRKSTSGHVFMLNSGAILWSSKKQQIVTLSTTKLAEFVAAASSSCQVVWLRKMLEVLGDEQKGPTIIYYDNMSTIKLSRNPVMHERSKHIDVSFHFLRDLCKNGKNELQYCKGGENVADIMTKPLKQLLLEKLRNMLRVCSFQSIDQGETADEEDYVVVNKS